MPSGPSDAGHDGALSLAVRRRLDAGLRVDLPRVFSSSVDWKFVPFDRRLANARTLQNTQRLAHIATTSAFGEVLLGSQGGQLLGDGDVERRV